MTVAADLIVVPQTSLYAPVRQVPGENMLFLRWDTASLPQTLLFEDTWADEGAPAQRGYFVFLNAVPAVSDAPALAELLRRNLAAPVATGFVWTSFHQGLPTSSIEIQTAMPMKFDSANRPCVDGNIVLKTLPGIAALGFEDGALAVARRESDAMVGVSITYTGSALTQTSNGIGVALPIVGLLTGCATFQALINAVNNESETAVKKALVDVAFDPLHPVDPERNFTVFTGQEYWLTQDGSMLGLSRVISPGSD